MGKAFACLVGMSVGVAIGSMANEKNMKACRKAIKRMM